jgi:hypothetical protein
MLCLLTTPDVLSGLVMKQSPLGRISAIPNGRSMREGRWALKPEKLAPVA